MGGRIVTPKCLLRNSSGASDILEVEIAHLAGSVAISGLETARPRPAGLAMAMAVALPFCALCGFLGDMDESQSLKLEGRWDCSTCILGCQFLQLHTLTKARLLRSTTSPYHLQGVIACPVKDVTLSTLWLLLVALSSSPSTLLTSLTRSFPRHTGARLVLIDAKCQRAAWLVIRCLRFPLQRFTRVSEEPANQDCRDIRNEK